MQSIVLIVPYFGKLPDYFHVWKETALYNETVDFLFFTDIDGVEAEKNIKVVKMSFFEFRALVQSKFEFEISLERPYKLCDYKPAYGYILSEYIKGYDFWGHCDIDLLFGNIRGFLTDEILLSNKKILEHGHLTLYHNDDDTNTIFMRGAGYGGYTYKKVFSFNESLYFDEHLGTQLIFRKENVKAYYNVGIFFQVAESVKPFQYRAKNIFNAIFYYEKGHLYVLWEQEGKVAKEEILYAHFLKRHIDYSLYEEGRSFFIVPNRLIPADHCTVQRNMFHCKGQIRYKIAKKFSHIKSYLTRYNRKSYGSFLKYRKFRKNLKADIDNAKKEVKKYRQQDNRM